MPILVPYGDPQTHGTLGKSITFRRWRGKVVMEKKPFGRQPDTPEQIAIRNKFKQAWKEWYTLNQWKLEYLETKAVQLGMTPSNLWIQMYMKDIVWSQNPLIYPEQILNMDLPEPIGEVDEEIHFTIFSFTDAAPPPKNMGSIWDAENTFTSGMSVVTKDGMYIQIETPIVTPFTIPYNYPILIEYQGEDPPSTIQLVKLPELSFPKKEIPSTTNMNRIKEIIGCRLLNPVMSGLKDARFAWQAGPAPGGYPYALGRIYDNENLLLQTFISPVNGATIILIDNETANPFTIPYNYIIEINWIDFADLQYTDAIYLPEINLAGHTQLILYIADDWSLYYDQALTNLANSPYGPGPYKLYLASDWSLYFDKNLEQLANTPIL